MENQRKDAVGLQPTEPDLLYQKPANYARRKPMEQTQQEQFIIRRIGGTTYMPVSCGTGRCSMRRSHLTSLFTHGL